MGFFDFFRGNEEEKRNKLYKRFFDYYNTLPKSHPKRQYIDDLTDFTVPLLEMLKAYGYLIFEDTVKLQNLTTYFLGAFDFATQRLKLEDDDALSFMTFVTLMHFHDGNYKKYGDVLENVRALATPANVELMTMGANAYRFYKNNPVVQSEAYLTVRAIMRDEEIPKTSLNYD